jgi:hypothetical protein
MTPKSLIVIATLAWLTVAVPGRTETMVSANVGTLFGGYLELPGNRLTYGGALTYFAHEGLGFELDVARTNDVFRSLEDTSIVTVFTSVIGRTRLTRRIQGRAAVAIGGVRTAEYGVRVRSFVHNWHPCGAASVGAMAGIASHFGVRADLRYAFSLEDAGANTEFDQRFGNFSAWSAMGGVYFRF